ncbi:hypothetical protein Mycch_0010 [Mycolicibacterium chubuense NBB4]|uniref:Uncharacterized protein n=1 Tax=Mycolicibacterium chubuense (strain NBB4) TaxID=710421 RepID=I4BC33_MYCCN|nr:hypothetical protein Mycch_0010 [Mycolicibacterium chubuense NBB4]
MKLVLLLAAGVAAVAALAVWRTQHGADVWHTLADAPS